MVITDTPSDLASVTIEQTGMSTCGTDEECLQWWELEIFPNEACVITGTYAFGFDWTCRDGLSCTETESTFLITTVDETDVCAITWVDETATVTTDMTVYADEDFTEADNTFFVGTWLYGEVVVTSTGYEVDRVVFDFVYTTREGSDTTTPIDILSIPVASGNIGRFRSYLAADFFPGLATMSTANYRLEASILVFYDDGTSKKRTRETLVNVGFGSTADRAGVRACPSAPCSELAPEEVIRMTNDPARYEEAPTVATRKPFNVIHAGDVGVGSLDGTGSGSATVSTLAVVAMVMSACFVVGAVGILVHHVHDTRRTAKRTSRGGGRRGGGGGGSRMKRAAGSSSTGGSGGSSGSSLVSSDYYYKTDLAYSASRGASEQQEGSSGSYGSGGGGNGGGGDYSDSRRYGGGSGVGSFSYNSDVQGAPTEDSIMSFGY